MRLTLDNNCLIDLEQGTGDSEALWALIKLHRAGKSQMFVSAVSASENLPGKVAPENFAQFEERLKKLGIDDLPKVLPVGTYGMTFWGASEFGDANDVLANKIKSIIHANADMSQITPKSRNAFCDIEGLAAHIRNGHDIFVTSDHHFLKSTNRPALLALGAQDILTPSDALLKVTIP